MISIENVVKVDGYAIDPKLLNSLTDLYTVKKRGMGEIELFSFDQKSWEYSFPWSAFSIIPGPIEDKRSLGFPLSETKRFFVPRKGQEDAIRAGIRYLSEKTSGVLVGKCGTGKTICGAEISLRLGRSTCVVVHKDFLANQWVEAFRMLAPDLKIGFFQRDQCDFGGEYDVVIATIQTITNKKREYPEDIYKSFGLVIFDELHRYGADVWGEVISKFHSKYRLGLTATFRRWDGMMDAISHHVGEVFHTIQSEEVVPRTYLLELNTRINERAYRFETNEETHGSRISKKERGKLISLIAKDEPRSNRICRHILDALAKGRRVFVLSDRLLQLEYMENFCVAQGFDEDNVGFFIGQKSKKRAKENLDIAATKQLVLSTYQMAKEGLDIPELDTLFLATPVSDIEQGAGRILRPLKDGALCSVEKDPVIVDPIDKYIVPCFYWGRAREDFYRRSGYKVQRISS